MSGIVTSVYFLAFVYVVLWSSPSLSSILDIMDSLLDLLGSLSNTPVAFLFALLFNFVILLGFYSLNICSFYMAELSKKVEWRRSGGRGMREVEMRV